MDISQISHEDITQLLRKWSEGDESALEELTPLVYRELYRLARGYMGREKEGHTLQPTALVNEAYLRLIDWKDVEWRNRAHFFAVSAQLMRRILVDYARSRCYAKRGGGARPLSLEEVQPAVDDRIAILLEIDLTLQRLAGIDSRLAQVVELQYFGGLTIEETARALEVSPITVVRDWKFARAWLLRELGRTIEREPGTSTSNSNPV
jgi:RNA polymerase sigma factor (TIGR02999 family)